MAPTPTLLRAFRHPLVIASILVLLLNDHVLKATLPSPLTGKLSDFAGLFFFPFLLGVLIQALGQAAKRLISDTRGQPAAGPTDSAAPLSAQRALALSVWLCAIVFTAIKTLPEVNAFCADLLARLLGLPVRIALDPTDLIALGMFVPVWKLWQHLEARALPQPPGWRACLALALGSLAALATSPCPPDLSIVTLTTNQGLIYASLTPHGYLSPNPDYGPAVLESMDGGLTWAHIEKPAAAIQAQLRKEVQLPITACDPADARQCYRIDGSPQVEESRDGGRTWRVVWQVPPERQSFMRRAANPQLVMRCGGKDPDFQTFDLVLVPGTGTTAAVVVAMGNEGVLARRADGSWQRTGFHYGVGPQAEPTPFTAQNFDQFLASTQTEMWLILGLALLVYLLLTQWGWIKAGRSGHGNGPGARAQVLSEVLWVLMLIIAGLIGLPYLIKFNDFTGTMAWLGGLSLLTPATLILSIMLWTRAGQLIGQPGRYAGQGWRAFGLGWLWFALVYGVFGLWVFGLIPAYEMARVGGIVVGLLGIGGAIYILNRRLVL